MKILVVGDWHSRIHEEAVANAMSELGHTVVRFEWCKYFQPPLESFARRLVHMGRRLQNKYLWGPTVRALNRDLVKAAKLEEPDLIFVYRASHIVAETLEAIRNEVPAAVLATYNNDDPFSPSYPPWLWRHFIAGIPFWDIVFAYRESNISEYLRVGARRSELLRSFFVPERIHPMELTDSERQKYASDVVFAGHYEEDGRLHMLETLAREGLRVRIYGPAARSKRFDWNHALRSSEALRDQLPVRPVWGEEYAKVLSSARIALCFLSKLNRDTYTRRSFEIPASGSLMLSEYTPDLATLFAEGVEAEFFRSPEELLSKVELYLADEERRKRVALAGYQRVYADGHDVQSRMREMLAHIEILR
jgi:spore maturation protein CgeB